MKEHTRNLTVGLTVLVALIMFAGMIVLFAGLPEAFQPGWELRMRFPSSGGVAKFSRRTSTYRWLTCSEL